MIIISLEHISQQCGNKFISKERHGKITPHGTGTKKICMYQSLERQNALLLKKRYIVKETYKHNSLVKYVKKSFVNRPTFKYEQGELVLYLLIIGLQSRCPDFLMKTSTIIPSANRPSKMPMMISRKIVVYSESPDKRPSISLDGLKDYKNIIITRDYH